MLFIDVHERYLYDVTVMESRIMGANFMFVRIVGFCVSTCRGAIIAPPLVVKCRSVLLKVNSDGTCRKEPF